jgi:glyoxylase-like metal-dependent hydrolase (beta-lactamase superfamily II)
MAVTMIDCRYLDEEIGASFLLEAGGEHAIVETSTVDAVPIIVSALEARGVALDRVKYLIVTHAHLDHAGGLHALARLLPRASVVLHPAAAAHLAHPKTLIAGTKAVFGPQRYEQYFREVRPLEGVATLTVADGQVLELGGHALEFIHTLGHATHHVCVVDRTDGVVFTGDAFGVCYPFMRRGDRLVVLPLTPPMDFDLAEAAATVDRICGLGVVRAELTHYGAVHDVPRAGAQLRARLSEIGVILDELLARRDAQPSPEVVCLERLRERTRAAFEDEGVPLSAAQWDVVDRDLRINAAGIVNYLRKYKRTRADRS